MEPERSNNSHNAEGENLTAQQAKILAHIVVRLQMKKLQKNSASALMLSRLI